MKHFASTFWKVAQEHVLPRNADARRPSDTPMPRGTARNTAICYSVKPGVVRSFATSGQPFLTFYEFNDFSGWYRDVYFAPDHVQDYASDIGQSYTVWTHETRNLYRRHIFLDRLVRNITISFEIPDLKPNAWFPLRIRVFDGDGLYFQSDQKLVVERLQPGPAKVTSWRKFEPLRDSLVRIHDRSRRGDTA